MKLLLFLMLAACLVIITQQRPEATGFQFCGRQLAWVLQLVCGDIPDTLGLKPEIPVALDEPPRGHLMKRDAGLFQMCCYNTCTVEDVIQFCP